MNTRRTLALLALLSIGCAASSMAPSSSGDEEAERFAYDLEQQKESAGEGARARREGSLMGATGGGAPPPPAAAAPSSAAKAIDYIDMPEPEPEIATLEEEKDDDRPADGKDQNRQGQKEVVTRAWFPETFLFQPQLVTDAEGRAAVEVTVPDRLTDWRVLGLAHSRTGAMAGDTLTFQGTLPIYVDPILPPFLRAGDQLILPVQVVNTTDQDLSASLQVSVTGSGRIGPSPGETRVGAGGSVVRAVGLTAERAGELRLRAAIGDSDAVERTVPIEPLGRPLVDTRGGTLAAPREVSLIGPYDAEPGSARARLTVYPGALAILRAELTRVEQRGGLDNDAYALLLSGQAADLLATLGGEQEPIDHAALRDLQLIATQRVIRHARSPDVAAAVLLAEAALVHPEAPVLERLGARLTDQLLREQLPDGTFASGPGWTLQRLLVHTAEATATIQHSVAQLDKDAAADIPQRARLAQIKANGAYERLVEQAPDPYTAAAILHSGAIQGDLAERLRDRVREAIVTHEDGSRSLPVPEGVVRADGTPPSLAETTALAALALADDPQAQSWRADLGATLLSSYTPGRGWGDGRANLTCLRAVLDLFKTPLPDEIQITLKLDGRIIDEAAFDRAALREVLVMEVPAGEALGPHTWTIEATPALPGLGYALSLQTWVPWEEPSTAQGLEVSLSLPDTLTVGQPATVKVNAVAPSRTPFIIEQRLPAGVQVDEDSLQALVVAGSLTAFNAEDGKIRLEAAALSPGDVFSVDYKVIPTLAGTLHSGALSIAPSHQEALAVYVPPVAWQIR